ncbi:MAG: hypothetical protein O7C75_21525 [Verrucomicrobia bacterium]|nr:hypothetical protein [Verrucomicrobiota bacterium]
MISGNPKESDWKRFRKITPDLREKYLAKKNAKLLKLLTATKSTPTEQFWDTFEVMLKEKRILESCLDGHSRSRMFDKMLLMRRCGMLPDEDLEPFSDKLKSDLTEMAKILRN